MKTRSQKLAKQAIKVVASWRLGNDQTDDKDPNQFARRFPSLVQTSGLLSAISFARVKNPTYANGFKDVLEILEPEIAKGSLLAFEDNLKKSSAVDYMRMSRCALEAATWIKRYVPKKEQPTNGDANV